MREIKFRAWDSYVGEMYSWSDLGRHNSSGNLSLWNALIGGIDHFHLMQFTGLTDRNGAEVYEGDIFFVPDCYPFISDGQRNYLGVIEYIDNAEFLAWYYDLVPVSSRVRGTACGGPLCDLAEQTLEAIGNIHEHPHLLDTTNSQSGEKTNV